MNKLKFWRTELTLSQLELSAASGVPRYLIQLAEQLSTLPKKPYRLALAKTLGRTEKELFPKSNKA